MSSDTPPRIPSGTQPRPRFAGPRRSYREPSDFYDRLCNVREVTRLRTALAAERARADRLAVELATLRGMNHMCTALANRVGAYNS